MNRFLVYLLCGLVFMLLQTTIFPRFLPSTLRPNLLLILILYLGLSESFGRATLLALLLGALQDTFTGTILGLYGVINLAIFVLVRILSGRLNTESPTLLLVLIGGATLAQAAMIGFCLVFFTPSGAVLEVILSAMPSQVLVNILAGTGLLYLLLQMQPKFGSRAGLAGLPHQSKHHGP